MYTYPKPCRITQSQSLEREDSTLASILSLLSCVGPVKARPEHGGQDGQPSSPRGQGLGLAPPVITGGCLHLESQNQQPEHRSPERWAGTASHQLAVVGVPRAREPQLSRDVPVQHWDLEGWDHSTRRQRKRVSGHSRSHWIHPRPLTPAQVHFISLL